MKTIMIMVSLMLTRAVFSQETVLIGDQEWTKQNINVGTMIPNTTIQTDNNVIEKYCYNNLEANCTIYGGHYQWDELMKWSQAEGAQGICPTGFHVPTYDEWMMLIDYLGGTDLAGAALKETGYAHWNRITNAYYPNDNVYYNQPGRGESWKPTNESEFTALGAGYVNNSRSGWLKDNAFFWTSTKKPSNYFLPQYPDLTPYPVQIRLANKFPFAAQATMYPNSGSSLRCLKN